MGQLSVLRALMGQVSVLTCQVLLSGFLLLTFLGGVLG